MIPDKLRIILKYLVPPVAIILGVPILQKSISQRGEFEGDRLCCAIAATGGKGMRYSVGYNYEMLSLFSWQIDKESDIFLADETWLDSLETGAVDIVVVPYSDSLVYDQDYYASVPLADSSAWIVNGSMIAAHKEVNLWLSRFCITDEHAKLASRFKPGYEPHRRYREGWKYNTLSPYDDLIRKYSAELGWEREMLTALIWHESQFRIEAHSRRGAVGLMQMMPRTANRFEADNLLDPEENIRAAVKYLKLLQRMFSHYTKDKTELAKFTLAAYNAGEGRIKDCINYAASIGAPHHTWNDIVAIIPDMREDSILDADTVKLGKFKGYETISYVEKMTSLYDLFSALSGRKSSSAPAPSKPDPHPTRKDTAKGAAALSQDKK